MEAHAAFRRPLGPSERRTRLYVFYTSPAGAGGMGCATGSSLHALLGMGPPDDFCHYVSFS